MAYQKTNPNGQETMANSTPVVIASDQSDLPVTVAGGATEAKQDTQIALQTDQITIQSNGQAVTQIVDAALNPVTITDNKLDVNPVGGATSTKQDDLLTELQQKTEPTDEQSVRMIDMGAAFKAILNNLSDPLYLNPNTSNVRVELVNGTVTLVSTVTTVGTVTTVTGITNIGGSSAKDALINELEDQTWSACIRNLIA